MPINPEASQIAEEDYQFICRIVYEQSRIHLGSDKRGLVTSRLNKRLRQLHLSNYGEYCQVLRSAEGAQELHYLIDRISTNHTHFFREIKHFDFLESSVIARWSEPATDRNTLRIWSAACSSGEEPYSIAILLAEKLAPAASRRWTIEASDISTRVLDVARCGIYDAEHVAGVRPDWLHRHFQKGLRDWEGHFRVKKELRSQIKFHHLNLLQADYPFTKPFHVIFCRNVMIYFDRPTQTDLVNRLSDVLAPGGYLMVGHSESLSGIDHPLRLVQPAVYVKA